jgi:hypothetical protein
VGFHPETIWQGLDQEAIYPVGSHFQKYSITCSCDKVLFEEPKYLRVAWKFSRENGKGAKFISVLPRGVRSTKVSIRKLVLRINSLEDGIEGWYHCEWRSIRMWDNPYTSSPFKLIPDGKLKCTAI